jgi:hypothetical protein
VIPDAGSGDEGDELLDKLERLEGHVGGAIAPATTETVEKPSVRETQEALGGQGGSCDVAAQALEAFSAPCRDGDVGVKAQTPEGRAAGTRQRREIFDLDSRIA